jgi:hypothetical protein
VILLVSGAEHPIELSLYIIAQHAEIVSKKLKIRENYYKKINASRLT